MDASGMNPATAAAFEGMMQQKQVHSLPLYTAVPIGSTEGRGASEWKGRNRW